MVLRRDAEHRKDVKHAWHTTDRLTDQDLPEVQRRPSKSQLFNHWKQVAINRSKIILRIQPEPIVRLDSALARVQGELIDLKKEEDQDIHPTPYAYSKGWVLIALVGRRMQDSFPYGYVMDDGDNGVRIEWEHDARHVRLVIPSVPHRNHYIYYQEGETRGTEKVTVDKLVGWLYWLIEK